MLAPRSIARGSIRTSIAATLLLVILGGFEWEGPLTRLLHDVESPNAAVRASAIRRLAELPVAEVEDAILRALDDVDVEVRLEAAHAAARLRLEPARGHLLEWVDDPDETLREGAVSALGELGGDGAVAALTRALDDARAGVRRAALESLRSLRMPGSTTAALRALDDADASVRALAATALGALGAPEAASALSAHVLDDAPEVRAAVLTALAATSGAEASPLFVAALDDDVEEVRLAAVAALGRAGSSTGVAALEPLARGSDARLARAAVAALGSLEGDDALSAVIDAATGTSAPETAAFALRLRARHAPEATIHALADRLSGAEAVPIAELLAALATDVAIEAAVPALIEAHQARRGGTSVLRALGASGARDALLPLLVALEAERLEERVAAVEALSRHLEVGGPDGRAVEPLLEALGRATEPERLALVDVLARVGAPRAAPVLASFAVGTDALFVSRVARALGSADADVARTTLLGLLDHADGRVRGEAARALGRIGALEEARVLLARLDGEGVIDRHAVLEAIGGIGARLASTGRGGELVPPLRARAVDEDERLADAAILALGRIADAPACEALGSLLSVVSRSRGLSVLRALGRCAEPAARQHLHDALVGADDEWVATAAGVLGERGDAADAERLLDAVPSLRFPATAAASFSLARLARRGVIDAAVAPALCAFGERSHDTIVRANVAVALGSLGVLCEVSPSPERWIERPRSTYVRAAAARWLAATERAPGAISDATRVLAACSNDVSSSLVAEACLSPALAPLSSRADVVAYGADGRSLLPERWLALHLGDGSLALARTDANARLVVEDAPAGPLGIELPENLPLEP